MDTIIADIKAHRNRLPTHPALDSIFFGGGTPSLLPPSQIGRIIDAANDAFNLSQDTEITIESNPNDILESAANDWLKAGVNRLSIGLQSLNDQALSFLGRDHDALSARRAIDHAQSVFENHSLDAIYARPGQRLSDWEAELGEILDLGAPHLSLYELTIEARTAFGKRAARGELVPLPDDDQADLYELTQALCEAQGLSAYEVSNHARDSAFESRHNHIYWASGDWIGVGPGAHGRITIDGSRLATEAPRRPEDYIADPSPVVSALTPLDSAREYLAMALRPTTGVDLERFETLFGAPPPPNAIQNLLENGLATLTQTHLVLNSQGRLMADYIAGQLAPY